MPALTYWANAAIILWLLGLAMAVTVRCGGRYVAATKRLVTSTFRWTIATAKKSVRSLTRVTARGVVHAGIAATVWTAKRIWRW